MSSRHVLTLTLLLLVAGQSLAAPLTYQIGQLYCGLTHPAELVAPIRQSTCEQQHVIQRQSGGGNEVNLVWWAASSHVRTDIWSGRPWENNRPWIVLGFTQDASMNLEKAYMLGTFGQTWSLYQHSYNGRGDSSLILKDFDGVSNLLYFYSWMINLPQKYINKVAYIADRGHWHLLVDMLIAVPVLAFEVVLAIIATIIGLVVGTLWNPLDTLFAIPGGLWLAAETTLAAGAHFITGTFALATSGIVGFILVPITLALSFVPFFSLTSIMSKISR